jgi:putative Holliday junction resolvase
VTAAVRSGVRLGVDPGTVRVGVAASDPDGLLATPLRTLARSAGDAHLDELEALVRATGAVEVVVGLPRSLGGGEGPAAVAAREYAGALALRTAPVPVRLVDERLTTVDAERVLRQSAGGRGRHGRTAGRARREVIDQAAAVTLLQHALDSERSSGRPPGELVEPHR